MNRESYIVQNIDKGVWKIPAGSNIYLLRLDENILIDTGDRKNRREEENMARPVSARSRLTLRW